jgi:hypothetical protein
MVEFLGNPLAGLLCPPPGFLLEYMMEYMMGYMMDKNQDVLAGNPRIGSIRSGFFISTFFQKHFFVCRKFYTFAPITN